MVLYKKEKKKHLLNVVIGSFIVAILFVIFSSSKSMAAKENDIYDVILFWGQSNMVGYSSRNAEENFDRTNQASIDEFNKKTGISKDILKNTYSKSIVKVPIKSGTAYQYRYTKNKLEEITNNTTYFGENLSYNSKTKKLEPANSNNKLSIQSSSGKINMIPEFCKIYYEKTGRKVIAIMGGAGGQKVKKFLPKYDKDVSTYTVKYDYVYEAIVEEYKATINYLNKNNYKIGNRYAVCFQGESDRSEDSNNVNEYKRLFKKVDSYMQKDLGITKHAIVYTAHVYGTNYFKIATVHRAQKELINENKNIILGSSYAYDRYVPEKVVYESNNYTNKYYTDSKGKKMKYEDALAKARLSICYNSNKKSDNSIHYTSATLSQIGMDTALAFVKDNNSKTCWENDIYYKNGQKKYKRDSKGIVTDMKGNKVTVWIEDERYTDGKLSIKKDAKDNKYKNVELDSKGRFKSYKEAITRWVGNRYFQNGTLYAEVYNKSTKKISTDGKAYRIGYKKKDGTIDESKLIKNKILGSRYFNEKGETEFKVSNKKAYKTEKGIITNKLYSGIAENTGYNAGKVVAKLKNKKLYIPEKDSNGNEKLEKLYDGFIGNDGYKEGNLVAKISSEDKLLHKVKSDGSGKIIATKYTGWIGKKYFNEGKETSTIPASTASDTKPLKIDTNNSNSSNDLKEEETTVTAWVDNIRYYNGKATYTKKIDRYGRVTNMNGELTTGWIGNEFYLNGVLRVAYKEENGKNYAYIVRDGKISNNKVDGFAGSRFFENGILKAGKKDGIMYKAKDGILTDEKYSGKLKIFAYKDGIKIE